MWARTAKTHSECVPFLIFLQSAFPCAFYERLTRTQSGYVLTVLTLAIRLWRLHFVYIFDLFGIYVSRESRGPFDFLVGEAN